MSHPMPDRSVELATLVGSRICHDLISPVGAINNGIELLQMSGVTEGPEMTLIGQSAANASARIRFFRIAFGSAGDQMVGQPEIASILRDVYKQNERLEVNWTPQEPQPRAAVRLSFMALLCLETAMPFGGQINVSQEAGRWTLRGDANKLNIDADLWAMLARAAPRAPLLPSQVQFGLLPISAAEDGRKVTSQAQDTSVMISF